MWRQKRSRCKSRCPRSPKAFSQRPLSDDREKIPADRAVHGERSPAEAEESEAGRPDHQRKFQIGEGRGTLPDNEERSGHDQDGADSRKTGEETEEKTRANRQFRNHDQRSDHGREPETGRGCPCFDCSGPAGSPEPTEGLLGSVKEENSRCRQSQDEGPSVSRGVEEVEDGIVRHGAAR